MLVNQYKDYYMGLSRYGKLQVAGEVVKLWRNQSPSGRFLAMTDPTKRENTSWHDIGDKEAVKKTSQCLRERIPPNQKARTLAMVSSKAKALQEQHCQETKQKINTVIKLHEAEEEEDHHHPHNNGNGSSNHMHSDRAQESSAITAAMSSIRAQQQQQQAAPVSSSEQGGLFSDWEHSQHQQLKLLEEDCEPRPVMYPSANTTSVSVSNTSGSSSSSTSSVQSSYPTQPLSSAPQNLSKPGHNHGLKRGSSNVSNRSNASFASNFSNWNMSEIGDDDNGNNKNDDAMWDKFFEDQTVPTQNIPLPDPTPVTQMRMTSCGSNYSSNQNNNNGSIDTTGIPSAANLTRDVFDNETMYQPTNIFKQIQQQMQQQQQQSQATNYNTAAGGLKFNGTDASATPFASLEAYFMGNQMASSGGAPSAMTLNQTLSSGFANSENNFFSYAS